MKEDAHSSAPMLALDFGCADHVAVLWTLVGRAMWLLKGLEATAADYVGLRLRDSHGVGIDRGQEIAREVEKLPLGRLVKELINNNVVTGETAKALRALLTERNWLVHRAFRESHGALSSEATRTALFERLDGMAVQAQALNRQLAQDLERYVVSCGVSPAQIDRDAERLARSWGFRAR